MHCLQRLSYEEQVALNNEYVALQARMEASLERHYRVCGQIGIVCREMAAIDGVIEFSEKNDCVDLFDVDSLESQADAMNDRLFELRLEKQALEDFIRANSY